MQIYINIKQPTAFQTKKEIVQLVKIVTPLRLKITPSRVEVAHIHDKQPHTIPLRIFTDIILYHHIRTIQKYQAVITLEADIHYINHTLYPDTRKYCSYNGLTTGKFPG